MDDLKLAVALAPRVRDHGEMLRRVVAWGELCSLLAASKADDLHPAKDHCPLWAAGLFGDGKASGGKLRHASNRQTVTAVIGDYDEGSIPVADVVAAMRAAGIASFVHTSARHTPQAPKWRLVVPLSRPAPPQALAQLVDDLAAVVGCTFDKVSKELGRFYFFGRVEGAEFEAHKVEGVAFDMWLQQRQQQPPKHQSQSAAITLEIDPGAEGSLASGSARSAPTAEQDDDLSLSPNDLRQLAQRQLPPDIRELAQAWAAHWEDQGGIGALLESHGYEAHGDDKWLRPDSTSGIPGVMLMSDGEHVFNVGGGPLPGEDAKGCKVPHDCLSVTRWVQFGGDMRQTLQHVRASLGLNRPAAPVSRGPLRLYKPGELAALPPADWLVRDLLPLHGLACLYGAPGAGKSFCAMDMALAVAQGTAWMGKRVKRRDVLYVAAEGSSGFTRRIRAHELHHGQSLAEVGFYLCPELLDMTGSDSERVRAAVEALGEQAVHVGLIVVDTLNRTMGATDENSTADMTAYVSSLTKLAQDTEALVLVIHHSGKDASKGARGSTVLLGAVDAELRVSKTANGRLLEVTKQKEGKDGLRVAFDLLDVEVDVDRETLEPIAVPVVVPAADTPAPRRPGRPSPWAAAAGAALTVAEHETRLDDLVDATVAAFAASGGRLGGRPGRSALAALEALAASGAIEIAGDMVRQVDPLK